MKAAVCRRYGPPEVLTIEDVPPPALKAGQILVRVRATAVNSADVRIRSMNEPGLVGLVLRLVMGINGPRNRILGGVVAGTVEQVGEKVSEFKPGDEVFTSTGMAFGGYAEYIALKASSPVALKPRKASFEEAAAIVFGGMSALYFLERGGVKKGTRTLVYGASGSVGTSYIQIARLLGARVSAVTSTGNLELARSLGAETAIDYTKTDYTTLPARYDLVFDATGHTTAEAARKVLNPGGKFITTASMDVAKERKEDLHILAKMFDAGELQPVIERVYPFAEIVAAHRHVDTGHKRGNVVVLLPV